MVVLTTLSTLALVVATFGAAGLIDAAPASAAPATGSVATSAASAVKTAAGTPGTPQTPTTIYAEDFQNAPATGATKIAAYTSTTGATYTADPIYQDSALCNGVIFGHQATNAALGAAQFCGASTNWWSTAKTIPAAMGQYTGMADPSTNLAVAEQTIGGGGPYNGVMLQGSGINAGANGRFVTFALDVGNLCNIGIQALDRFYLMDGSTPIALNTADYNICADPNRQTYTVDGNVVSVGTFTGNQAALVTSQTVGFRVANQQASGSGNDQAFDNFKMLDATPQLDKSFSPASVPLGHSSVLTFTITNTTELAAKNGWSFTDSLPSGLTVTSPAATTTCPSGTVTAAAGSTSIKVGGNLTAGMASCTVTVNVTATQAGDYTNGPDNVTETGLNPPADTTVTFTPNTWTCSAFGYLFQTPDPATHQVYQVDLVSGASSKIADTPDTVNAVGYNTLDDYVYGYDGATASIVRVGADGALMNLGLPDGVSTASGYQVGDFDDAGHLWIEYGGNGSGQWYEIDYAPGSSTYGQVLDSGIASPPAGVSVLPSDWTYVDGVFYGVQGVATGAAHLIGFDATTHKVSDLGTLAATAGEDVTYGAAYADASGYVYASNNSSGNIYRVDPKTRATILVSHGPASGGNDGARCATAPIPTITVTKTVADRVQPDDQFTVGLNNAAGTQVTSATTEGTDKTASTTNWPVSQGATYTITDAMAAGSPDAISSYVGTIVCTDTTTGDSVTAGGSAPNWTLTVDTTDAYTCAVTNTPATPSYTVTKTSDPTGPVAVGGTETYTVSVTNTGPVPYTEANPASFSDTLTDVLDDATFDGTVTATLNGAAVSGGSYTASSKTVNWEGALPVGATVEVTYTVTVTGGGDNTLTNAAVPGDPSGICDNCSVTNKVASFTLAKTVDSSTAEPGDVLTYTVTVTNTGAVAYDDANPASFTDDLSGVLDDATYNNDAVGVDDSGTADGTAAVSGSNLTWTGPLAVGGTVSVVYSVTVNTPDTGDHAVTNAVTTDVPGGGCDPDSSCETTTDVQSYSVAKQASADSAAAGTAITYTVTVTNTGQVPYTADAPASFTDDLSGVLDDAKYNKDASGGASVSGTALSWSGALAVGAAKTITYSVTVDQPDTGDHNLANAVVPDGPGGACTTAADCLTSTPVQSFSVLKSSTSTEVNPGESVPYTVTITNTGQVDYTADAPAAFTDDLSSVLDDATYNDDADNGATYTAPVLSWSGALAVGESVTVSYSVTVNDPDNGDKHLDNTVVTPDGSGGDCPAGSMNLDCTAHVPQQSYTVSKVADSDSAVPGASVKYTVTVTNTGAVDYTDGAPASFTDDLSNVLDDATYNDDATGGATVSNNTLSWSGALASGATKTITYSVTVNTPDAGDHVLSNAVVPTTRGGGCDPDAECSTTTDVASFSVKKISDSADAAPGDTVTYTVTVTNTGTVAYTDANPAAFTDDLSKVLDDATFNEADTTGGATLTGNKLSWSGALDIGATATVTYTVTVNSPDKGDHELDNAVVPDPSKGGGCDAASDCATTTLLSSYNVAKKASVQHVAVGQKLTYTVTVTNTGKVAYTDDSPASFTDDLSDVLKHADYNGDASNGATVTGHTLSWSGALAVGGTQEVTYSVTVHKDAGGDTLKNAVIAPPSSGADCQVGSDADGCSTQTKIDDPGTAGLADTGSTVSIWAALLGAILAAGGAALVMIRRRSEGRRS